MNSKALNRKRDVAALLWCLLLPAAHAQAAAPTNLLATPGDGRVTLSWDVPRDGRAERYEVCHGTNWGALGDWSLVANGVSQHTVADLTNGRRYYFMMRARSDVSTGVVAHASAALAARPHAVVDMPDDRLRAMLGAALGVDGDAEITQGQMATLRTMSSRGDRHGTIADLKGIEFAVNATELGLYSHDISDLSPLAQLRALEKLWLDNNQVVDLSPLAELPSLGVLKLRNNRVSDLSPLAELTRLYNLDLSDNRVSNISVLAKRSLLFLELNNNDISDISPLAETSLQRLYLGGTGISDLSPLGKHTEMTHLGLAQNQISDISPLAEFTRLRYLDLSGNRISDIAPLANMEGLLQVYLHNNQIADLSPLAEIGKVRYLHLHNNAIADISALAELPLHSLDLHNNRIADVAPLADLTDLEWLHLRGNRIADISPLAELTALGKLDLGDNRITDVSPLSRITGLRRLALDHNAIADIASLGGWSRMGRLFLNDNAIVDVSALAGHVAGAYVDLRGNPLGSAAKTIQVPALRRHAGVSIDDGARRVPFFPSAGAAASAGAASRHGFARVINHSDQAGVVHIVATDEAGRSRATTLSVRANAAVHFDARDLEQGDPEKGLTGVGVGEGHWRLALSNAPGGAPLDIEVLGYVRTPDGLLTSMHDLAPEAFTTHHVWMFNPGSNRRQVSRLRLVNPHNLGALVSVYGRDDAVAHAAPLVDILVPARRTLDFTAAQLESGEAEGMRGGLGDGKGKWWLSVESPVRVMHLLESPSGHLANLSSPIGKWPRRETLSIYATERGYYDPGRVGRLLHRIPLFPSAPAAWSNPQGFLRAVALANRKPTLALRAFDDAGRAFGPDLLRVSRRGSTHFNSNHLEAGDAAKGLPGTGASVGDWHLELRADQLFQVLGYARLPGGAVVSLYDVAPRAPDGSLWVPFFNPADDAAQGVLRLVNWGDAPGAAMITGVDDAGRSPGGIARVTIPAGAAVNLTAEQLESGRADGLSGSLGDGEGRWRLRVEAPAEVDAMSLLRLPTGQIANLSTTPRYPPFQ